MKQPTRYEITEKIKGIVEGKISRDSVDDWVNYYISHDDEIEMIDIEAWHYLTELGTMCVQIAPNEYLYTTDDLLNLVKEYTQSIKPEDKIGEGLVADVYNRAFLYVQFTRGMIR